MSIVCKKTINCVYFVPKEEFVHFYANTVLIEVIDGFQSSFSVSIEFRRSKRCLYFCILTYITTRFSFVNILNHMFGNHTKIMFLGSFPRRAHVNVHILYIRLKRFCIWSYTTLKIHNFCTLILSTAIGITMLIG